MPTTYDSLLGLAILAPLDPATNDAWGTIQAATMPLIGQAVVGNTSIDLTGLLTYTLTSNNNASDQRRLALWNFINTPAGNCVVTIPGVSRIARAVNNTAGGHTITLTTGSGRTAVLPAGYVCLLNCDGTNVDIQALGATNLNASGTLGVTGNTTLSGNATVGGTFGVTGASTFTGALTIPQAAAASTANPLRADQSQQEVPGSSNITMSGVATQAFPLSSAYRRFQLRLQGVVLGTAGAILGLQFSSDGGVTWLTSANYEHAGNFVGTAGNPSGSGDSGGTFLQMTVNSGPSGFIDGSFEIFPGSASLGARVRGSTYGYYNTGAVNVYYSGGGAWTGAAAAMNYARLIPSSGVMSGTLILEGLP